MWEKLFVLLTLVASFLLWKITQKEHNKYKFRFKFLLLYIYASLCAFIVWPFFLLRPKSVHNARFGAWVISLVTKIFGIKYVLRNSEILTEDRGAVVVSNHQTSLDILGLCNIWHVPYKMTAVAKKEIFYVWPFGLSAYLAGVVFVDRTNPKNAYKQLQITTDVLIRNKTKIWVFPEGTRNHDTTKMLPFKKGAFAMAVAAQVPIIPVVFSPYYFIDNENYIMLDKGRVIIQCMEPISTKGLSTEDIPDLMNRVKELMMAKYKELTKEVIESLPPNYPLATNG